MITCRTFLVAMATASLVPLVGCSGGQQAGSGQQSSGESKEVENRSEPKPLEITESGWSVVGDGWVYYGFALKNTNKDVEAQMPTVTITGKAENGLQNIMAAIEQGIVMPEFTDRIAQLQAQKARAERDLASYDEARIDPEEFADFLQCGGGMDDAAVLDSFVYQVMVTPEECVATLY